MQIGGQYGKPLLDKWFSEVDYFITNHIHPSLTVREQSMLERERAEITRMITQRIEKRAQDTSVFKTFSNTMNPVEFEAFCAEQL